MSTNSSILLRYAAVQMAAEADYLGVNDFNNGNQIAAALLRGNNRSSRFTAVQATEFTHAQTGWRVIDHKSNTTTGFSGTLFKSNATGELVLSFRSTEFADDSARDNQATNVLEIKEFGWAFGQISDMKGWYEQLVTTNKIPAGAPITVTGYSLGGHLATAFSELFPGAAAATYTFNGAGVGKVTQDNDPATPHKSLTEVIELFTSLRNNSAEISEVFRDDTAVQNMYAILKEQFGDGGRIPSTRNQGAILHVA